MSRLYPRIAHLIAASQYRSAYWNYAAAIVLSLIALLLTYQFDAVSVVPFFPLFTLAVLLASIYGGSGPGIVAVVLTVLLNYWVMIPPRFSFAMGDVQNLERLAVYAAVNVCIAVLAGMVAEVQAKLDRERQRLKITLTSIGDAVLVTDAGGRVTFLNPVAEEATGWTLDDALGQPLENVFRIINEKTRATVPNPVRKVMESGTVVGLANHTMLVRKDGVEIPIDDSAAPIRDGSGAISGVVLVFRDISERRRTEAALLVNEKLVTLGRLASTIAHEINNPLAAVSNMLYLASAAPDISPTVGGYLEMSRKQLERVAHVTRQALSIHPPQQAPEPVELADLTEDVLRLYESKLEQKQVKLLTRFRHCPPAWLAAAEMRQVIGNLLSNALEAITANGAVQLRVAPFTGNGRPMVRLTVADSGIGIAPQNLADIFEPFFTTKDHGGTGLGLWITKRIVDTHRGKIRVRSRPGRGSVFWILLPAHASAAAASK
jgi:PAS domain S-box-containing protein